MAEAVKLLLTGMGTVFFILIMVVLLGNLIIRVTNMFYMPVVPDKESVPVSEIAPSKLAAIVSAVDIVTKGKGKVTSVKKVDK